MSIPAQKNPLSVNPLSGRFQTTFNSQAQDLKPSSISRQNTANKIINIVPKKAIPSSITQIAAKSKLMTGIESARNQLLTSGSEYLKLIDSGDLDKATYLRPDGTPKPKFMEHIISDLAGKLDFYSKGLGKKFKDSVNLDSPTAENLIDQAIKFLNKSQNK